MPTPGRPCEPSPGEPSPPSLADLLLDRAPVGLAVLDRDLRYLFVNPCLAELHGVPAARHLGRTVREVAPPFAARFEALARRVLDTGQPALNVELLGEPAPPSRAPCSWTVSLLPLGPPGAPPAQVGCVVLETTERRLAELALRGSEERLRLALRATRDAVWDQDLASGAVTWGEGVETLFGYPPSEAGTHTSWFFERVHPEDRDRVRAGLRSVVANGGRFWSDEYQFRRRDGEYACVLDRGYVLYGEDGKAQRILGAIEDITARKQAEQALAAAEAKFRSLVEQSLVGIYIIQGAGFAYVNPKMAETFGYTQEEIIGRLEVRDLVAEEDRALVLENIRRRVEGEVPSVHYSFRGRRRDGTRIDVEVHGTQTLYSGRPAVIGTLLDVTEQRRLEQRLRQTQKMEAVGRLAGGVAHDFNNLLTVIGGYVDLILGQLGPGDRQRHDLEEVRRAAQRATALTRQLLAFSRQQVLQPRVLDINEVVAGMERMLRRLIGEDVELVNAAGPGLWPVKADPGQLEQVILNLALNARDAMPHGGQLSLETANVRLEAGRPGLRLEVPPGPYVMLAMRDTGVGMDAATLSHLFEPFFTTKEQGKGTGLGTATVYGIVEQSGGTLEVSSRPGRGTTFRIYLPRASESPGRAAGEAAAASGRGTETVLLAEDEPQVRRLAAEVLRAGGYRVVEAANGAEALDVYRAEAGPIHILVSDVVMPEVGGVELVRRLHALRPDLRVLYLSGYSDDAVVQLGGLRPGTAFMQKPFRPEQLLLRVRELLDGPAPPRGP
ncbi:MAG TPA: PAS domain S-box protein [Candidatus Saccharimonadales bacterium]|nr:PAS domain S-box protein [Candidatus Saccharimonadales bacterium]